MSKLRIYFSSGIAFGWKHHANSLTIYFGWILVDVKTKFHRDYVKRINDGMWPKTRLWIIKYCKFRG